MSRSSRSSNRRRRPNTYRSRSSRSTVSREPQRTRVGDQGALRTEDSHTDKHHSAKSRVLNIPSALRHLLTAAGAATVVAALAAEPAQARQALSQNWPPFVLVAGLLLVGFVAEQDRLFSAAGNLLARLAADGFLLFFGSTLLIALVTAVLNLDTSVAFLTPILVYAARERGEGGAPLLYGCLLLSNAASLLLPGSNLTNLIVLGRLRLSGEQFLSRMAPVWLVSVLVTALVIALLERDALRADSRRVLAAKAPTLGLGVGSVIAVTVLAANHGKPIRSAKVLPER